MKDELEKKLCVLYPEMMLNRSKGKHESPFHYGFEHGDGWYNILQVAFSLIDFRVKQQHKTVNTFIEYKNLLGTDLEDTIPKWYDKEQLKGDIPEKIEYPRIAQCKEKFGTMRLYMDGVANAEIETIISFAEMMSEVTCEVCGAPGESRSGSWVKTLCDEHEKQ